jgi:hypothetical protein
MDPENESDSNVGRVDSKRSKYGKSNGRSCLPKADKSVRDGGFHLMDRGKVRCSQLSLLSLMLHDLWYRGENPSCISCDESSSFKARSSKTLGDEHL